MGKNKRGIREDHLEDGCPLGHLARALSGAGAGRSQCNQWHYFAVFAAVIAGLILNRAGRRDRRSVDGGRVSG
jgi:hypothetical protein